MEINQSVHDEMVRGVLASKVKFFEVNTQGSIINRFSKDVAVLDSLVFTYLEMVDVRVCFNSIVFG